MRSVNKQQEWAKGQINNPSQNWDGMCQSFSRQSYGMGGFGGSAAIAWGNVSDQFKHKITKYSDKEWWSSIPQGALIYSDSGKYGHAWIAAGDGAAYSNDYKRKGRIDKVPVDLPGWSNVKKATLGYLDGAQYYSKDGSHKFGLSFELWDDKVPPFENVAASNEDRTLANAAVWRLSCRLSDLGFGGKNWQPVKYEQKYPVSAMIAYNEKHAPNMEDKSQYGPKAHDRIFGVK